MRTMSLPMVAVLFVLLGTAPLAAQATSPWSLHARLDVYTFSVKAGAGFDFNDSFGLSGSLGVSVINPLLISYALTGVHHLMPPDRGFQLDVEYGLVQASLNVLGTDNPSAYWVTGACVAVGYRFRGGHQIALRAEGGAMFGYDNGSWQDVQIMPNLGLEYSWRKQ